MSPIFIRMFVRLKILWFTILFLIFQVYTHSKELYWNLPLESIRTFSSVPISEVAPKFSPKILIKIFQKFVANVSKMFRYLFLKWLPHFHLKSLSKYFKNL